MRVDGNNRMLELKEKNSFTDKRHQEHASVGVYYFKRWSLFKEYCTELLQKENNILPEYYVSLLYNDMVADKLDVLVHEVEKFICLGTPSDYEQYQYWCGHFQSIKESEENERPSQFKVDDSKSIGLIPMAGKGSRFKEYGYRVAKPLIRVLDTPMVIRAARSLPAQDGWIFLIRQEDLDRHPIREALHDFHPRTNVKGVKKTTSGQAATCMLASDELDDTAELMIASCDYETVYDQEAWGKILSDETIDGAIWTIRLVGLPIRNPQAFAYCKVDSDKRTVLEISEKKTISGHPQFDPLVVGTFWYRKAGLFKQGATHLIENDIRVNGEHYVGTSINHLIKEGFHFVIFDVEKWISYGDPFELQVMEYWNEYFESLI